MKWLDWGKDEMGFSQVWQVRVKLIAWDLCLLLIGCGTYSPRTQKKGLWPMAYGT